MIKHISKIIWTERKINAWILLELILVFCILWFCTDYLYFTTKRYLEPKGFDIEHTYRIGISMKEEGQAISASNDSIKKQEMLNDIWTIYDRIKRYPATEYISYSQSAHPYSGSILLLAKNKKDFEAIAEGIRAAERKFNVTDSEWNLTLLGPYNHSIYLLNTSNNEPDIKGNARKNIFIFAILLLIPAINLSSFSLSRIRKRTEEIGIRKAFGAKRYVILFQVLYENFITSLIGGIIDLLHIHSGFTNLTS